MDERAKKLMEKIDKERGFVMPWRRMLAERDPECMELYHKMAMHFIDTRKAIPRKYKEIILICADALTFYEPGLRAHIRNALNAGATEEEILEALELVTLLGIHSLSAHLPALIDEVDKFKKQPKA